MMGIAYSFFRSVAGREIIDAELPMIRFDANTPKDLELILTKGMDNVKGDDLLMDIAHAVKKEGINYMFKATLANTTNMHIARELEDIMQNAYNSMLHTAKDPLIYVIIFKHNGTYIFTDKKVSFKY